MWWIIGITVIALPIVGYFVWKKDRAFNWVLLAFVVDGIILAGCAVYWIIRGILG